MFSLSSYFNFRYRNILFIVKSFYWEGGKFYFYVKNNNLKYLRNSIIIREFYGFNIML